MDRFLEYSETFRVEDCSPEDLPAFADAVLDELLLLEDGQDQMTDSTVSIDASLMTITVEIAMHVPADLRDSQAEIAVRSACRTAFHAVGGFTPEWDVATAQNTRENLVLLPQ